MELLPIVVLRNAYIFDGRFFFGFDDGNSQVLNTIGCENGTAIGVGLLDIVGVLVYSRSALYEMGVVEDVAEIGEREEHKMRNEKLGVRNEECYLHFQKYFIMLVMCIQSMRREWYELWAWLWMISTAGYITVR